MFYAKLSKTVEQLIFMSSSMVYGNFDSKEVDEEMRCLLEFMALKYAAEKIIIAYNQVFDLNYTIIRPYII